MFVCSHYYIVSSCFIRSFLLIHILQLNPSCHFEHGSKSPNAVWPVTVSAVSGTNISRQIIEFNLVYILTISSSGVRKKRKHESFCSSYEARQLPPLNIRSSSSKHHVHERLQIRHSHTYILTSAVKELVKETRFRHVVSPRQALVRKLINV